MSKQVKYFCNLCTEEKKNEDLMCMYFDSTKMFIEDFVKHFGGYVLKKDLNLSDKHICLDCIDIVIEQEKTI